VVAGSDGAAEWDECRAKAAPVLAAAGLPAWDEPPPADAGSGRCFDTALVVDGRVIELGAHLERFRRSTGLEAAPAMAAAVASVGDGTWRLRLEEVDGRAVASTAPAERPAVLDGGWGEADIALVPFPGGLGRHKWADRARVQALERCHAPFIPVLCDDGDELLEATWANVFVVVGGCLWTPPLDGRILPGVTRRAVLDEAVELGLPVRIGPVGPDHLAGAEAVLLSSAVRGIVWVRSIRGGRRFDAPPALLGTLTRALGRRWSASEDGQRAPRRWKML